MVGDDGRTGGGTRAPGTVEARAGQDRLVQFVVAKRVSILRGLFPGYSGLAKLMLTYRVEVVLCVVGEDLVESGAAAGYETNKKKQD